MDQIKISVGELINFVMRSGDIDQSFIRKEERMKQGQKIHQEIQKKYGDGYKKEVPLSNKTIYQEILFDVSGRADGIYRKGEDILIDEIKSTTRDIDEIDDKSNPLHWAQVKTYGYFYGVKYGFEKISLQCTYCHVETKAIKSIKKDFTIEELKNFYTDLLSRYMEFSKEIIEFKKTRDQSIEYLAFPYPHYRKGQREMAVAVYQSIREQKNILLEAPTGIGKTMSTIFPSVKALGSHIEKIFYLTSKTSIKEACNQAIFTLNAEGLRMKSCTLTAKEKLCINNEVKCNPKDCPYAKGHYDRVNECIMEIYEKEDHFLPEIIIEYAEKHRLCPVELQFDLSSYSDMIIGDYNYVFDPIVYLKRFFDETLDPYVFLVDEAHNLVSRGRDMYSAELSREEILDLQTRIKDETKLYRSLVKISELMENLNHGRVLKEIPDQLDDKIRRAMGRMEDFLYDKKDHPDYEEIQEFYFRCYRFMKIIEYYSFAFRTIVEEEILQIYCLDPSEIFQDILQRAVSTTFFSATLQPMDFYGEVFGLLDYYKGRLPSPFDPRNLDVGIIPISTRYRDRGRNLKEYRGICQEFLKAKGNAFLFFPSYSFMDHILEGIAMEKHYKIQRPQMTRKERQELLHSFTEDSNSKAFLVLGGSFSESIDLTGEKLVQVLIFSVGLPGVDIRQNLIRDYFDNKKKNGFEYAYIYPGMNKVAQAAGRVIRTKDDHGKVLLVDDRFLKAPYHGLLPKHWRKMKVLHHRQSLQHFMERRTEIEE